MSTRRSASSTKSQLNKRKRYKNESFLKRLGDHCRKIRIKKGYSIDRLSKESDQLSPASINRLEKGTANSQVLVLLRLAEALGVQLVDLFSFLNDSPDISKDDRIIPYDETIRPSSSYVPVYPLKVAAGKFSTYRSANAEPPIGWIDLNLKSQSTHQDYFAAFIQGDSMSPKIKNGDLCLFRKYTAGTRQGKIFLIQARSLYDSETGESFVIKKYMRQTPPRSSDQDEAAVIHLISENPKYSPIILYGMNDEEIQTIAEFIRVL